MKKVFLSLITLMTLSVLVSCGNKSDSKPLELKVMTFNIRLDTPADSLNNWQYRKDVAAQIIKNYDVDIVGTQEVKPNQMQDLKERLPEYVALGVGREDGKSKGEHSALFYKKDKFKEIESGTFWLSETPEVAGSMGWDAACPRVATWAVLEDIATGKKVFAINTHLDHKGKEARINGVTLMLEKALAVAKDYPVILTGDFNAEPDSDVILHVIDEKTPNALADSKLLAKNRINDGGTYNGFGSIEPEKRLCIDYVFVSKGTEVNKYEVVGDKLDDVYLSDHNPIVVEMLVK